MSSNSSAERVRVFISYSWDSDEYRDWVARFAARLVEDGIDARLDAWHLEDRPIPDFMDIEVREADKVMMLCTPKYQAKIYAMQKGDSVTGTGYESMLITTAWFAGGAKGKIIPIVTRGTRNQAIPTYAQGLAGYDLSAADFNEKEYKRLLQYLYDLGPKAPKLGVRPDGLAAPPVKPLHGKDARKKADHEGPLAAAPPPVDSKHSPSPHHFICYSEDDGLDDATRLRNELASGKPSFRTWMRHRDLTGVDHPFQQIGKAISTCESLLFVMTPESVKYDSLSAEEWQSARSYKKPILPLLFQRDVARPFGLGTRQAIDFTRSFEEGLERLREYLATLNSPRGRLRTMKEREEDLQAAQDHAQTEREKARINDQLEEVRQDIALQEPIAADPEVAERRTRESIRRRLELQRQPEKTFRGETRTKFINPPPGVAPTYFQDRYHETKQIGQFLDNKAQHLMTVVGRAGTGKTIMVCRLLKALEKGYLPDDLGEMRVDGILYLSQKTSHRVDVPNLFGGLLQLLPASEVERLQALYKDPKLSVEAKFRALLDAFPSGRVAVLLDNFEDLIDPETQTVQDNELGEALRTILDAPSHGLKVIITTREAPRALGQLHPARQTRLDLDAGLPSPHAENLLREMDEGDKLGLKKAPDELLNEARKRTHGNPRALEALYGILSTDWTFSLEDILESTEHVLPERVVEVLVGEAFSRLDALSQQVMQALAIYGYPVPAVAVDYLLQPYLQGVESTPVLRRLMMGQFVRKDGDMYHLHETDRVYALSLIPEGEEADRGHALLDEAQALLAADDPEDVESSPGEKEPLPYTRFALLDRAADYFNQVRTPRASWKTIEDLASLLAEFDLRCEGRDYNMAAHVLLDIAFDFLLLWGHARLMVQLSERVLGKISDRELEESTLGNLGSAYLTVSEVSKAIECYEKALAMACEIGDRHGEADHLGNLGNAYLTLSEVPRAIEYYAEALAISRVIRDRRREGNHLGNLGLAYSALGEVRRSIEYYKDALAIACEIGDRRGEGNRLGNLGLVYSDLGEVFRAIEYQAEALAIASEIGDRRGEGNRLGNLGNSYLDLGEVTSAMEYYEEALAIACEIGDRRREGVWLGNLGLAYSALGDSPKAIEHLEKALVIVRNIGSRDVESAFLHYLGQVLVNEGEHREGLPYLEESVRIAQQIQNPLIVSNGTCAFALAHLYSGDLSTARSVAEAAKEYDVPTNNHYASALLGVIALRQGDRAAAQAAFEEAVLQAEGLLARNQKNYGALDVKGLALCGRAVCTGERRFVEEAIEAYRAAREIIRAKGVVGRVLRLLEALAVVDVEGMLAEAHRAASGE